jgi:beta-glucanase (GH16 family)
MGPKAESASITFTKINGETTTRITQTIVPATGETTTSEFETSVPSVSSVTVVEPAACPSGECMPVGDLPGWRQDFVDDFNNDVPVGGFPEAVSGKWGAYEDGWSDTSRKGTYMPSQVVSVHDGVLDLDLHTANGEHLVATPWPRPTDGPGPKNGHVAGRYVVRFRADRVPGYKFVGILYPDSGNNLRDGELNFPEADLDRPIYAYTHHVGATTGNDQDSFATEAIWNDWHTAVIERTPHAVRYLLDGQLVGTSSERIPTTAMTWNLQAETSLSNPTDDIARGHVLIDWVAIYFPA